MWHEIKDLNDINSFMEQVCYFHDSCLKELKYISGAYVNENLSMYPINDKRVLSIIIQRQFNDMPMLELEFSGLKYLKLFPNDERYTCEILDSTMLIKDGNIYWCDCGYISEMDILEYEGTLVCASKLRWRFICENIGPKDYYVSREDS